MSTAAGSSASGADQTAWLDGEPVPLPVVHGLWSLVLHGDSLDDITYAGLPTLRAVRFVVRDHDWRTVPTVLTSMESGEDASGFWWELSARTDDADVQLTWTGRVQLTVDTLRFEVVARAANAFRRNRIGIIVLHSPALAGHPLTVHSPSDTPTETLFPQPISPHQPAVGIAALEWSGGGLASRLAFAGDVFEMEDQRNWTDASFKIYSTPLSRPFPVAVNPGDTVRQSVVLTCALEPGEVTTAASTGTTFRLEPDADSTAVFPELARGAATGPAAVLPVSTGGTVLVELDLAADNWRVALQRAASEADAVDVRLITSDPDAVHAAVVTLADYRVVRVGVFDRNSHVSEPALWHALQAALADAGMSATRVGGTRAHFTEFNRAVDRLDINNAATSFSTTAQMHDRSRRQVIESIPVQRLVAEQAVRLSKGAPVHIGPVTLRPRFNAVATTALVADPAADVAAGYGPEHVRDATDPRQRSTAAAAWLVSSATALAVPGVASVTYFETVGARGFGSADGTQRYPVAEAWDWLTDVVGGEVLVASVSAGEAAVLVVRRGAEMHVLAANLESEPADVAIEWGGSVTTTGWSSIGGSVAEPDVTGDMLRFSVPAASGVRWVGRRS